MEHVRRELKVSERRACRVLGKALTVQQYTPQFREDENALTGRIVELSSKYGRHGTPRITGLLLNEGLLVNQMRVERIWRSAGLKVPKKTAMARSIVVEGWKLRATSTRAQRSCVGV